ncbi:carcinine hydrolase/isopenicillin-N N-acyltransferase family protein [Neobacillus mesonae]|uniref:carcinine hydrolase/isopenicillin-N N-acyltransferase family protein n=1 Tax=Neobacillus mesonae TaxID=1193713 RepID=UPI00203A7EF4|nr:carcinine hydrolase/isopenicillin-N N-acyltransferase family protein [Neobacillus mesonae]MCM3571111.1 carcinine hydrolase/isopenicillin-N N-acyltransferase family protein [Neobacillus mesonae]
MCTCGAISTRDRYDQPVILIGKTMDFYESAFWHGKVSHTSGYTSIGFGVIPQIGINSGMNEKGLCVLLSFLDYRGPFTIEKNETIPNKWLGDDRALLNAQLLARCSKVEEAIAYLYEHVPRYKDMPGGNHMLVDKSGTLAVFEHCNGQMDHKYYTDKGYTARGNNGFLTILDKQASLPNDIKNDRSIRCSTMESTLAELYNQQFEEEEILQKMQQTLSSHQTDAPGQVGNICLHAQVLPGARASTYFPLSTISSIIFNVTKQVMYYTTSTPCQSSWHQLDFSNAN